MNEYIPYEQSKELVSLGFNYEVFEWYDSETEDFSDVIKDIPAILYQQAFRFFRDEYDLVGSVLFDYYDKLNMSFEYGIAKCRKSANEKYKWTASIERFKSYEEAELELLKVLINIAKYNPQWATY